MAKPANYEEMEWSDLKEMAHSRGLQLGPGRTKKVISKELRHLDLGEGEVMVNRKKGGRPKREGPTEAEEHMYRERRRQAESVNIVDGEPDPVDYEAQAEERAKEAVEKGKRTPADRGHVPPKPEKPKPRMKLVGATGFTMGVRNDNCIEIRDERGAKVANFFRAGNPLASKDKLMLPHELYAKTCVDALNKKFGG